MNIHRSTKLHISDLVKTFVPVMLVDVFGWVERLLADDAVVAVSEVFCPLELDSGHLHVGYCIEST